jgi:hypothetical protein
MVAYVPMSLVERAMRIRNQFSWSGVIAALQAGFPRTMSYETIMSLGLAEPEDGSLKFPPTSDPIWLVVRDLIRSSIGDRSEIGDTWRVVARTDTSVTFGK